MSELPVFTKLEADRILKRAAEIEGAEDPGPMSLEEIRSIAGEAGFGLRAVERAIAEAQQAMRAGSHRPPVHKSGLVIVHLSTVRQLPVEISSEQLMRAVRLFSPYREGPPELKLEEHQVSWRDRKKIRFTVTSAAGLTEVRVMASRPMIRRGRWRRWVKDAADRIESLIYLIATQDVPAGSLRLPAGEDD